MPDERWRRRSVITGLGATAAALTLGGRPAVQAQSPAGFTPARHDEDAWFDRLPGVHRVFVDSASATGASDALLYAGNLFAANKSGYDLDEGAVAIVVCFRHRSTPFAFDNAMWAKYGEPLARTARYELADGQPAPTTNPHLSRGERVSPRAIDGLAARGVHYAICDMATRSTARQVATAVAGDPDAIYEELRAHPVPNGRFVSAGVVGLTRAQEYGYSVLISG
jgi:hypothetical protein